jgi:streptogramin lyase
MDLDEQLREAGERWRASERAPVADFRRATRTARSVRTAGRRGLLAVPIIVAAALLASAVVFFAQSNSASQKVVVTQPTTPTSSSPSALQLDPEITQTGALAIDGASVWVTGYAPSNRAATLEHIDTRTGKVLGKVALPDNSPFQIVVAENAVWICSQQNEESAHLIKIDPDTNRITSVIPTQGDANVAVTPGAVWVDENAGGLLRLDPDTNNVLATIRLPGRPYSAGFLTGGPLGVFLANSYDGTVLRVDPTTNTVKQIADLGRYAGELVELDGSLWVNAGSTLVAIDPNTGAVVRTIARSVRDIVSDGSSLWASTNGPEVLRIDPRTGQVVTVTLRTGVKFAIALAADPTTGAVWAASDPPAQRLLRLAP